MAEVIVKICGLTRPADAVTAAQAGADLLGVVLAPSPRRVTLDAAKAVAAATDRPTVGVFVNQDVETVNRAADAIGLAYVQLHGDELPELCARIERPVIKAIRVHTPEDVARAAGYDVFAVLFDAHDPAGYGGTGMTFAWEWLADYRGRFLLAGGLAADNVRAALAACRAWGVDASSRLELSPGVKDPERVAAFIAAAKGATYEAR